jgi:hypothetical protein
MSCRGFAFRSINSRIRGGIDREPRIVAIKRCSKRSALRDVDTIVPTQTKERGLLI